MRVSRKGDLNSNETDEIHTGNYNGFLALVDGHTSRVAVNKFPGLGDIPILGHLFRSEEFEKGETELVIMVTAMLAQPMDKPLSHLPTDSFVEPSDVEFYLLGKVHGKRKRDKGESGTDMPSSGVSQPVDTGISSHSGGVDGQFGHSVE